MSVDYIQAAVASGGQKPFCDCCRISAFWQQIHL